MNFPPLFAVKTSNNSLERSSVIFKLLNSKGMRYRQRLTQAGDYISNLLMVILFRHFDWQSWKWHRRETNSLSNNLIPKSRLKNPKTNNICVLQEAKICRRGNLKPMNVFEFLPLLWKPRKLLSAKKARQNTCLTWWWLFKHQSSGEIATA